MSVKQIAQALGVSKTTINFWRRVGRWDEEVRRSAQALPGQFSAKSV
jgi:uncharacterized protein YjcR